MTTEAEVLRRELGNNIEVQQAGGFMILDGIAMNMKKKPLDDVRVRQAISLALERQVYFKLAYQGLGEVSGWMLGSGQWGLPKEELAKLPGYGPDMKARMAEAKKLLAEAGYPDGFKMTAMSNVATRSTQGLEWAVSVLPAIGIKVDMRPVERAVEDSLAIQGAFDMYAKGFLIAIDDPDAVFGPHLITEAGRNYWQYSNPEIDRLYAEQTRTLDREKRRKIVDEMHKIVLREVPVAIMGYQGLNLVTWAEVRNVFFPRGTVSHSAADISEVWLAK